MPRLVANTSIEYTAGYGIPYGSTYTLHHLPQAESTQTAI